MNKKIIVTLIVLLFCVSCLGIVSADNSTNETLESNETLQSNESIDLSNYIVPISISGNVIEFNDGFTGFCLDSTKESITTEDGFTSQATSSDEIQNYVKLAIIEAYKQGCEDKLGQIIASFADGSYKNSGDKVITEVLKSDENIGNEAVVDLEDSIEGTFEFELLKPATGDKSDCLAYRVSLKEVANDDKLGAAADDNVTEETENDTDDALTNASEDVQDKKNTTAAIDNQTEDDEETAAADNQTEDVNKTADTAVNKTKETVINETNKTTINKTNTLTINENNTTIINQKNTKIVNKTNDTPQNETIPEKLMKTVGNPIFILIVVIAIAAIVAVTMRRKE